MKDKSPLKINADLVKRARLTNYYTQGDMSTMGEWDTDEMQKQLPRRKKKRPNNENIKDKVDNTPPPPPPVEPVPGPQDDFTVIPNLYGPHPWYDKDGDGIIDDQVQYNKPMGPVIPFSPLKTRDNYLPEEVEESPFMQRDDAIYGGELPEMMVTGQRKSRPRKNFLPKLDLDNKAKVVMAERMFNNEFETLGTAGSGSIWDTWRDMDDITFGRSKQKHINNFMPTGRSSGLEIFENRRWKQAAKGYLKGVKEKMSNAIADGSNDLAAEWMENANNFIKNIKTFSNQKINDWATQNNDETQGNKGGSTISKGSHKGDQRFIDAVYMGADNVDMQVAEEGDIYFKMRGVDDIADVKDLNTPRVFLKNYKAVQTWENLKKSLADKAKEGIPVPNSSIEGTVESMLSNEQAVLSMAHDNMINNKSMYELLEEAASASGKFLNKHIFMPESKNYNLELAKKAIKKGLVNMASQVYRSYVPKSVAQQSKLSAKDLLKKYRK